MRPIPVYLITGIAAALAALPSAAQLATHAYSSGTGGTLATGTTSTTTGTTTATVGASGSSGSSSALPGSMTSPPATNQSTYMPAGGNTTTNAANGTSITGTTTSFGNGARYVVNSDGTVTVLSSVPTTTTTTTTNSGATGNTLAATVNGTGTARRAGSTTTLNPLVNDVNGVAPGQTSAGIAAGNSSLGIVDTNAALSGGTTLNAFAPGVSGAGGYVGATAGIDYGAMSDAGSGVNANGERVASLGGAGATIATTNTARTPTPTFDMAARAGMAKELNRRARGQAPRVYGIAPRTNVDRTDQMPDDPVIRY